MVIGKKHFITMICLMLASLFIFASCSKESNKDKSEKADDITVTSVVSSTEVKDDTGVNDHQISYFDENGKQAKIEFFNKNDKLMYYTVNIYDKDGNVTGEKFFNNKDKYVAVYYDGTYSKKYGYYTPNGKSMTEDEFIKVMSDIGAVTTVDNK